MTDQERAVIEAAMEHWRAIRIYREATLGPWQPEKRRLLQRAITDTTRDFDQACATLAAQSKAEKGSS